MCSVLVRFSVAFELGETVIVRRSMIVVVLRVYETKTWLVRGVLRKEWEMSRVLYTC